MQHEYTTQLYNEYYNYCSFSVNKKLKNRHNGHYTNTNSLTQEQLFSLWLFVEAKSLFIAYWPKIYDNKFHGR